MNFNITIIGSGDTLGTPLSGDTYPACLDPKSKRYRFGLLITIEDTKILIDTNPDLKWQCLENNFELKDIDYILITHSHSDHLNGMGEFFYRREIITKVFYQDHPLTQKHIGYFRYLENEEVLSFQACIPYHEFILKNDIRVIPILLNHGFPVIGYIITTLDKKIAVVTDSNADIPKETMKLLSGLDVLFIDAFSENMEQVKEVYLTCNTPVPKNITKEWFHMTFEDAKRISEQIHAKKTYPLHISRYVAPHDDLVKKHSTKNFIIPHDGMKVSL